MIRYFLKEEVQITDKPVKKLLNIMLISYQIKTMTESYTYL